MAISGDIAEIYLRYFYLKCLTNAKKKEKEQMDQSNRVSDGQIVRKP